MSTEKKTTNGEAVKTAEAAGVQESVQTAVEARIAELEKRLAALARQGGEADEPAGRAQIDAHLLEPVTIELFADGDRYSRDFVAGVNGKLWKIKHGQPVQVPRYVAELVMRSVNQDRQTANLIRERDGKYVQYADL